VTREETASPVPPARPSSRIVFLDVARGVAVVAMLAANLINVFMPERPYWLGHNLGDELLPLDLPAPLFQFLVGVSLVLFLTRRSRGGDQTAARWLAARRFALLIALGVLLDAVWMWQFEIRWGVLQTLGLGGLFATALADASDGVILATAAVILALHYGPGNNQVHRSALDCLPFVPLTLLGYVVGRPLATEAPSANAARAAVQQRAAIAAVVCIALALALRAGGISFNKVTGSGSFVAFAAAASAAFVAVLAAAEQRGWTLWPPLAVLGAHALTAWVLQYVLVYYPIELLAYGTPALPEASGVLVVSVVVVALSAATLALAKRGIRIPL
jgi:uncharacterized membrane protein YeiB